MSEEKIDVDAVAAGFVFAGFAFAGVILFLFLWAPAAHYLGRWNDFWETKPSSQEEGLNFKAWGDAQLNCRERAMAYWDVPDAQISTRIEDTSSTTPYATYDCYGVKLTKLAPSSL